MAFLRRATAGVILLAGPRSGRLQRERRLGR
jgi:hypothetical protein